MNAVLHGLAERPKGVVSVSIAAVDGEQVRLTVGDDGCGMSEEVCKKIFDPFFTIKMGRGGTGLGMNIVQGIVVRILGGRFAVESRPGCGTAVVVTLPRVAPRLRD